MKKLKGLLLAAIIVSSADVLAQSFAETALMFSRTRPIGSARIMGMGGAQISLGGDFSSAYSNPAGLGMYNRSEVAFMPSYIQLNTNGKYYSGDNELSRGNTDFRTALNFSGLGFMFSKDYNDQGFIRGTFGISFTRNNDFNRNLRYRATNPNTSLIDYFLQDAAGGLPNQFGSGGALYNTVTELAYDNYLIGESTILDPNNDPTEYFTDVDGIPNQSETWDTQGGQSQWNFSYGANFDDKFFLGAGIGVASINYNSRKIYRETFDDGPLFDFTLDEDLQIRGTGFNLTVGGIARPIDGFQVGASIATPTRYNLTDVWSGTMRSEWDNFEYSDDVVLGSESATTDAVTSDYVLTTPWKISAGATYFIQKTALITADIEHLNYASARYQSDDDGLSYTSDNTQIKSLYRSVTNVRLGGEYRLNTFRFRAGYNFMPDPFQEKQNDVDRTRQSVTAGVGYRGKSFALDLAYVNTWEGNSYRPYNIASAASPLLKYNQNGSGVFVTLGFSF